MTFLQYSQVTDAPDDSILPQVLDIMSCSAEWVGLDQGPAETFHISADGCLRSRPNMCKESFVPAL